MRSRFAVICLVVSAGCATTSTRELARVNDEIITGKELRQEFARHHYAMEKILGDEKDVRKYLDRLVDRRLFVQEGYRMGLQDAPEVKDDVARFRAQKLVEAFIQEEVEAKAKPTDDEVKAIHDRLTRQLEVRQIVVKTQEEAEALRAKVVGGSDVEALARERSIAESAVRGGLMVIGWGGDEAYETTLFTVKEGEVSPVFKSAMGWEVVRVEKYKTVKPPPYDKVERQIRQVLHRRKRAAREAELYGMLWAKYDAKVVECAPTVEDLKRAAESKEHAPCATWRGGTLTTEALARRVKLERLSAAGERWPELRRELVEDLVNREVILLEAEARGYGLRPEIVEKVRLHQDDLVEAKLYREYVIKAVQATPDDARAYYDAHRDLFRDDVQLEVAQIVVETPEVAAEVEEKIRSRQPFAELAKTYSKDARSAESGGRLGFIEKKALTGEWTPVAALGEGEVSPPIVAKDGVHIVKVLSVRPEKQRTFEEVAEDARTQALEEKKIAEVQRWVKTLRDAGKVEFNEAGIRAFRKEQTEALLREEEERQAETRKQEEARRRAEDERAAEEKATDGAAAPQPASDPAGAGEAGAAPATDATENGAGAPAAGAATTSAAPPR